jgi:hypothetical protein
MSVLYWVNLEQLYLKDMLAFVVYLKYLLLLLLLLFFTLSNGEAHLKNKVQDSSYDLFANVRFKQLLILGIEQAKLSNNSSTSEEFLNT